MIGQNFDEWVQSLYFPHNEYVILIILSFVILISVGICAVILIRNQKLTNRLKIVLLSISFIFGGILLGGVPNVVLLFQNIFTDIPYPGRMVSLLVRISIFIGLTLIFGRIFCGYVCPLGAIQELASMIRFKPKINYERKYWKKKNYLRGVFIVIYAIFSMIWGLDLTLFMNPINGFLLMWTPSNIMIFTAFIIFILTIFFSFFMYRPYCRYFCPFGAIACVSSTVSPLKIRRTPYCTECEICEKICPTLEGYDFSKKGECYLCYRCVDFCTNEMFIDNDKISQINRNLKTLTLGIDSTSKETYFDKIFKSLIRLIIPYKRKHVFEQLADALVGKKEMSIDFIQKIVVKMRELFPEEIKQLDIAKYEKWMEQNKIRWKEKIEQANIDKFFYGLENKVL